MSDGTTTWTYTYDADGMRIGRTNGTDTYSYIYNGSLLSQMTRNGRDMFFTYDAMGMPATLTYRGIVFFYVTNLQGDVMALMDEEGNIVVEYLYDAWGNLLSITGAMANTLGIWNPLTYRGYVYDHELEMYYLQSRYYDPMVGRFINADAYISTGQGLLGNNMYAYCNNNPMMYVDYSGHGPIGWLIVIALAVSVGLSGCSSQPTQKVKYNVPLYDQGNTNLCWAYCQVMIECYQNRKRLSAKKANDRAEEIARSVYGDGPRSRWDRPGSPTNLGDQKFISTIEELYDILNEHGPVYALYKTGNPKIGRPYAAHYIVVTGVDLRKGRVCTNDPMGETREQVFEVFMKDMYCIFLAK